MARLINRLNTLAVNRASERGYYSDGGGLYLQVSATGTKSWVFRYVSSGRAREMGLGSLNDFSLAEARQRAKEYRQQGATGVDPIDARRAVAACQRLEDAKAVTFKDAAEKYIAAHEAGWRSEKHHDQWRHSLETFAYPIIGSLSVSAIDTTLVMKILEQSVPDGGNQPNTLWAARSETAGRLRGRIEVVLDWAKARGLRTGENPARWKGHLNQLLPARQKLRMIKHHPALPFTDLPEFMRKLRELPGTTHRALEFAILTVLRTGEVIGARWQEFDLPAKIWTVPAGRMKGHREHRVPLCARAVEILTSMPRENEFVFAGERLGRPLASPAMLTALRRTEDHRGITVHGFRSTFEIGQASARISKITSSKWRWRMRSAIRWRPRIGAAICLRSAAG